jgi:hypothetical protein
VIKQVSAVAVFAALVAALIGVLTWPGEAQQRTPLTQNSRVASAIEPAPYDPTYTAGMRIIHVPQDGMVESRPVPKASYQEQVDAIDDDVEQAPPPSSRQRVVAPPQPRRVLPPAKETKRTMLNAPKSLHDGPSPIRPLPRWRSIEKFTELPKPVAAPPVEADPVAAPIPAQSAPVESNAASASDMPAVIDDDTPPPAN